MPIKNASSFVSTVMSTCTLVKELTGHAFEIFVSPICIFAMNLATLCDMSLSMGSPDSIYSFSLSKI